MAEGKCPLCGTILRPTPADEASRQVGDSSNRCPTPVVAGLVVAVALGSYVASLLATRAIQPAMDANLDAYLLVVQASGAADWRTMAICADRARSQTTDSDLSQAAGLLSRTAEYAQRTGVRTVEEANSWSGVLKSVVRGLYNPMHALDSLGILLDIGLADWKGMCARIDNRYQPILRARQRAETFGRVLFWGMMGVGFVSVLLHQVTIYRFLRTRTISVLRALESPMPRL